MGKMFYKSYGAFVYKKSTNALYIILYKTNNWMKLGFVSLFSYDVFYFSFLWFLHD